MYAETLDAHVDARAHARERRDQIPRQCAGNVIDWEVASDTCEIVAPISAGGMRARGDASVVSLRRNRRDALSEVIAGLVRVAPASR